ncbi:MAG: cytochrome c3 family protein [Desulfobacterales bacterium]|nr:MAG: cytochrome c3 family protein [Desulfobacterales bacterium]
MRGKVVCGVAVAMLWVAAGMLGLSEADVDKGAEEIVLFGGERGRVPFPHHRHQEKLGNCDICHSVYAQQSGIIQELKEAGKLQKKQIMNKQCTKCHKEKRRSGEKSGPTACTSCHIK